MNHQKRTYAKNIFFPCFVFSLIAGGATGGIIFLFKLCAGYVLDLSAGIYTAVREHPVWLPALVGGAAVVGLLAALLLHYARDCRGGGIPTSVAILRGLTDFHWVKSLFGLFVSALLSFLGGVPLGNEGPSVQMGTAIGRGTVRLFTKKNAAWDRYIMTGGACAGFAVATGAPLSGILFAFEEAHRRFSPMLFLSAAMTVSAATGVMHLLCGVSGVSPYLLDLQPAAALPLRYIWLAAVVGLVCGLCAILFMKVYAAVGTLLTRQLQKLPFTAKVILIFVLVAVSGFALKEVIGTGHDIVEQLLHGPMVWYLLLLVFCLRAAFLILANQAGISGGLFVPTLAFGALLGSLCGNVAVQTGLLPKDYYIVPVLIGMTAFLAATSRTPITAIAFALEALAGLTNILPITVGVTLAFLAIETWDIPSLHETVIAKRVASYTADKTATVVDRFVQVMPDAFAVGKEVRDILWPPTCTVLSIKRPAQKEEAPHAGDIQAEDILELHYQTYEPAITLAAIEAIVGPQPAAPQAQEHTVDPDSHIVPEV